MTSPGAAIAVLAAAPSVAWAVVGAGYLSDDFSLANQLRSQGVVTTVRYLGRPLGGLYHALVVATLGERPAAQALLLAGLNAAVAVAVWLALRAVLDDRTALVAALVFAVAPNRAATRLWFICGPNVLALALVAVGAVALLRSGRLGWAMAAFLAGMLLYEGAAGVAALALGWWWLEDRRARLGRAVAAGGVLAVTAAGVLAASPKVRFSRPEPFRNLGTLGQGTLGQGLWGSHVLGAAGILAAAALVGWALATLLPSFRRRASPLRFAALAGACLLVAGAAPFAVNGAPFAVAGIFDRFNLVTDVGASVLVGGLLAALVARTERLGWLVVGAVVAALAAGNAADVSSFHAAVVAGRALEHQVVADVDPGTGRVVVVPPLGGTQGVGAFILDGDLTAALVLHHGTAWAGVEMPGTVPTCAALRVAARRGTVVVYDRLTRTIVPATDPAACRYAT